MSRRDQLDAPFGDRPCCLGFCLRPDLVDDDHLRSVILDSLDHYGVLQVRPWHLHAAACSNTRMRNVTVAGNLVRGIDDDHAFLQFGRKNSGAFAKQCCFADAGPPQKKNALSGFDHIPQNIDGSVHRAANATGQPDNNVPTITDTGNTMKCSLNSRAIVHRK